MKSDVLNRARLLAMIAAEVAAIGAEAEVRLFTNDLTISDTTVPGDFTQPTGAWYAPADDGVAVYGEPYLDPVNGDICINVTPIQYNWAAAGGATTQTIRGYYIAKADGTIWYHANKLDTAKVLSTVLDSIIVAPVLRFPVNLGS